MEFTLMMTNEISRLVVLLIISININSLLPVLMSPSANGGMISL